MAAPASTDNLIELIHKSGVFSDPSTVDRMRAELPADPTGAAATLVRKGLLTKFQAQMLLAGKAKGFRLGDYVIQDQIGHGGMGAVYLAIHQTLGRKAAIKVLAGTSAAEKIVQERFVREARTAAALDHPNVVKLFDICKQGEIRFLVMEFVEGKDLSKLLQSGAMGTNRAVAYISQAAAGLQHAFEKGFIHRDIKPSNLILTANNTIKILDMGLARSTTEGSSLTETLDSGAVVGTADYLSPEQAMNAPGIDIRSDIYSLGITFYALVTGQPPFQGTTTQKLIQHQLKAPPSLAELDKTFPHELAAVVSKMMEKKPEDRYQTPAEVIEALQPWMSETSGGGVQGALSSGRMTKPRLGSSTSKVSKPPKKKWYQTPTGQAIAAGASVVVLGGLIGGLVLAFSGGDKTPSGNKEVARKPVPAPTPDPVVSPKVDPTPPPTAPTTPKSKPKEWIDGKVLYTLNLANLKPFEVDGTSNGMSNKTGAGEFPAGWKVSTWTSDARGKGFGDTSKGDPAIGAKSVAGNMILFSPELPISVSHVKLRFEYISNASERLCTVRLREKDQQKTDNSNLLSAAEWTKFEKVYEVGHFKSATRIEFHNADAGTEIRIRSLQLVAVEEKK